MRDILRLTVSLVVIALASGLAVGITYNRTAEKIEEQKALALQEARQAVLPAGLEVEERSGSRELPGTYWAAVKDGNDVAYAFEGGERGYGGEIRVVVGVDTGGVVLGVSVLDQKETPGLGTRVAEVVSRRYIWNGFGGPPDTSEPWFTEQFEGIDIDERVTIDKSGEWHALSEEQREVLEERAAVSAITGATISTRAVVQTINEVVFPWLRALREGSDR